MHRTRLTPPAIARGALLLLVGITILAGPWASSASATGRSTGEHATGERGDDGDETGRVLIIAAPRLTWAEVQATRPPNLMSLFERSAVALCSVRTAGSVTRPGDAYLTIGAGNRMGTVADIDGVVVDRTEPIAEGDPTAIYQRTTGNTATENILAIGKPAIDTFNDELLFGAKAGSLATALDRADRSMGVIANADRQLGVPRNRQAALAAMDDDGQVHGGMVSQLLLHARDEAALGLEFDPSVFATSFTVAWAEHDVLLVELSDLERAEAARSLASEAQGERQYRRALAAGDALVGLMLEQVDLTRDTVYVIGPTAPLAETQPTVFAMAGPGIEPGWADSSTTRREGYVTLTDLAPSALALLGADIPDAMTDTRMADRPSSSSLDERIELMADRATRAVARDRAFGPTTVVFIVVLVVDIALAMLCLARFPRLSGPVRGLALVVLSVPPVSYLLGLVSIGSPVQLGAGLALGAVIVATLAAQLRRIDIGLPPVALIALLWVVLAVDISTGGHLQINTIFGYSPIVAGRFAGFGNQAFSMIAISSLLLAAAALERRAEVTRPAILGVIVWFAVTVVLDGHPAMGSDVGGVLAFVPAATVAVLKFRGVQVRARVIAVITVGTVAALGAFAAVDMTRDPESQTHLGRFVTMLFDGQAGEVIERKIAANLRVLTIAWAWVIPIALVYFVYLTWRPNRTLQRLNANHSQFRAFGISALTLGVLAMALNDSGVSLPAIMLALVAAVVSYLVIDLERGPAPEVVHAGDG